MAKPDFGQLPALKTLLSERNISRAADKMNLSQPAMSRIFTKLKADFGDPLMVRAASEYQLTPRGQLLLQQLNQLIPQVESLWRSDALSLSEIDQTVIIAGTDMDIILISDQVHQVRQQAPKLKMAFRAGHPRTIDELIGAQIDLAITAFEDDRAGLYRQLLSDESFVVVAGQNCPLEAKDLDLETYINFRHGKFSFSDNEPMRGRIDQALSEMQISRKVSLYLPTFLQIPSFLHDPELLFSVPKSFANYLAKHFKVKVLPLPFRVRSLKLYLYWHERQHHNKLHRWLRQKFLVNSHSVAEEII